MAIQIEERYKQAFEQHRFTSEVRLKIVTAWGATYVAIAAIFVWAQSTVPSLTWLASVLGILVTLLLWLGDCRNRPALRSARSVGNAIEEAEDIPEKQRFFANIDKGISHSTLLNAFALLTLLLFGSAMVYLLVNHGQLPK